jgi:predicted MFS family arabinose efflux permease
MSSCITAEGNDRQTRMARVYAALALGVFGLIVAEFLPASLLTPMAAALGSAKGWRGRR